jgi:glyoxylase-like metal-dependent hydrolase (beta-lactamase superfamily II)
MSSHPFRTATLKATGAIITIAVAALALPLTAARQPAPQYEVFAIRYATLKNFRVSGLVAGADTARRMDIAMSVWLLRAPGRMVLVDAGFQRDDLIQRWKPEGYMKPSEALARFGVRPEDVTDLIVSHVHWDHMDGAELFPKARIWIQKEEYDHHVDIDGRPLDRAIDAPDAAMISRLRRAGRVTLVDGDAKEIIPGITVYTGGKHTFASQFAGVRTAAGKVVIASDNMYLYENLERHRPIAQTLDSVSNLAAQDRMTKIASNPRLIVPGHDTTVYVKFPSAGEGVVRIR